MRRTLWLGLLLIGSACSSDPRGENPGGSGGATGGGSGGAAGSAAGSSGTGGAGGMGQAGTAGTGGADECPTNPDKTEPGQCGCTIADSDSDGDGSADCVDACDDDPNKEERGVCDCGIADTDSDGDGAADCMDDAPDDPTLQDAGDCGTSTEPEPAGTACDDGACPGTAECDGAGHCGDLDCAPTGCGEASFRRFRGYDYWFCNGPVTWEQAIAACREVSTRTLLQINDEGGQAFATDIVTVSSWLGANDRAVEGEWRWADSDASDEGSLFWNGAADGDSYFSAFTQWSEGNPGGGADESCAILDAQAGAWDDVACDAMHGFVCWDETAN